jgi:probable HAF family extracellular repeat protein
VSDTTPPTLIGLTFPTSVDLSQGSNTITFGVSATDDLSGANYAVIQLARPIVEQFTNGSTTATNLQVPYPGSLSTGQSTQAFTLSPNTASGTYTIQNVILYDNAGNTHTYTTQQLQALGASTSFSVTNGTSDTTAPTLTGLTFPTSVDLSHGSNTITFGVSATDDLSGANYAVIQLARPIVEQFTNGSTTATNLQVPYPGSLSTGQSTQTFTLSPNTASGTYTIQNVILYDNAGNTHTYTTQQLQALGAPTSFTVTDNTGQSTRPTIAINVIGGDGILNAAEAQDPLTITGTSMGAVGQTITAVLNGAHYTGTVATDGTWSITVSQSALTTSALPDGSYTVTADVSDQYGNGADEATQALAVHKTLPTITINPIAGDDALNAAEAQHPLVVTGTFAGDVGQTVSLRVNHAYYAGMAANDGTWSVTIPQSALVSSVLPDGLGYSVDFWDQYGNPASLSRGFNVDQTAPTIAINPIAGDDLLRGPETQHALAITGVSTGVAGQTVAANLNGAHYSATIRSDGTWSLIVPTSALTNSVLPDGHYVVTADVSDQFGNAAQETGRTLTVQQHYMPSASPHYTYVTLNDPLASQGTFAEAINDLGQVVGYYQDSSGWQHGFLYSAGNYLTLDNPSANPRYTFPTGINDLGHIVGSNGGVNGQEGFLYGGGNFTALHHPQPTLWTGAHGINALGDIVGGYHDGAPHGFLYSGGNFTTLDAPWATRNDGGWGTYAAGINVSGQIVGTYYDSGHRPHGFLYSGGAYTTLDDPLAGNSGTLQGTQATGISDAGQVVGFYVDSSGKQHGFIYDSNVGTYTTIDHPYAGAGYNGTIALGINDLGQIVGAYEDNTGYHGFLATPGNNAPTVSTQNFSSTKGQSLAASSLFSVTDADQDAITSFQFYDNNPGATSGHFVVGGVIQPAWNPINVTAAQLAQTTFEAGAKGASDDLWVRAYDGIDWSAWKEFHVTVPTNRAPLVSVSDVTAAKNQTLAAANLFSVTDADQDAITNYILYDNTPGGGHFVINGVDQPAWNLIKVSAAELAQTTFQVGASGSDDLYVQAFDGTDWSAWKEFHVTVPPNHAPTISASDINATKGQSIAAGNLFSVTDADQDPITSYHFYDSSPAATSGYFVVNGVAQAANSLVTITAGQLSQTSFRAGASGSDDLYVQAFDGFDWSAWKEFHVAVPANHAPLTTVGNHSLHINDWSNVASWISYTDADNDAAVQYQFWHGDTSPSAAKLSAANGIHPALNTLTVSAAELGNVWVGGATAAGSETIWVRAFDGLDWSSWTSFMLTTEPNHAPVVAVDDHSLQVNGWSKIGGWISFTDSDGDAPTKYEFWYGDTSAGAAKFWSPAYGNQPALNTLTVNAADVGNIWVGGGTAPGTETMWVRAFDGTNWSSWDSFQLTLHV